MNWRVTCGFFWWFCGDVMRLIRSQERTRQKSSSGQSQQQIKQRPKQESEAVRGPSNRGNSAGLLVIDKGVHEEAFLDELLPFRLLVLKVAVVVVGDDDAVRVAGKLDDETVVIAHNAASLNAPGGGEHQDLLLLQLP